VCTVAQGLPHSLFSRCPAILRDLFGGALGAVFEILLAVGHVFFLYEDVG